MKKQNLLLALFTLLFSTILFAQSITLYDQPGSNAKSLGKIDLSSGVIPIFKPAPGDWVKVADPHNGNVGWVKAKDLENLNEARTYQIIQYGKQNKMTDEQIAAMVKKMRDQQETMQKAFQNMFNTMNQLFQDEWHRLGQEGVFPIIIPIVVTPMEKMQTETKKQTDKTTAPTKQ